MRLCLRQRREINPDDVCWNLVLSTGCDLGQEHLSGGVDLVDQTIPPILTRVIFHDAQHFLHPLDSFHRRPQAAPQT